MAHGARQILRAQRATRAERAGADDALHQLHMQEAPAREPLFELQQAFDQQEIDAKRATELQKIYAPYQQAGFLSDIYKGAPSSQMLTSAASQPSASPFQQAVGIGLGAISTAAGAKKANLFG